MVEWVRASSHPIAPTTSLAGSMSPADPAATRGGWSTSTAVDRASRRVASSASIRARLSVRDQIDHFAAADVVVGLHGAAMTNVVFLKPNARVLELLHPAM